MSGTVPSLKPSRSRLVQVHHGRSEWVRSQGMVDISRDVPRRRKGLIRTAAVLAFLGLVTLGFCQMKPPAPRVSSSSLWIDTVRAGPMSVEIRGAGTLVP